MDYVDYDIPSSGHHSNLHLYDESLFYTSTEGYLGMFPSCQSGEQLSSEFSISDTFTPAQCEPCQSGYYSLGVQKQCEECSITAEFEAETLHLSSVIDKLCEIEDGSFTDNVQEYVTDSIRSLAIKADV